MEKTLMHTCCAPCSVSCIQQLRSEGIEPVAYWYNPNIHPYQEYKARRDTLMAYAPTIGMELIVQENYGLREFCRAVCGDIDHRCSVCYALRLAQAAQYAARHGYDSFTTTLLVSPYQNHELLAETAERMGREYGVRFLYRDFRPGFRQGAGGPCAGLLYAEVLRLRVQRGRPLPKADPPGSEGAGEAHTAIMMKKAETRLGFSAFFHDRGITACWNGSRCPAAGRAQPAHPGTWGGPRR